MVHAGLGYLAAADATAMAAETQARCLQMLEQATAMGTAARASILAAFTSAQGYSADADYSPKAWLINKTGITKGAATALHRAGPGGPPRTRRSRPRWRPGSCRSRSPGRSAPGRTSCPRTAGRPPTRSWSPRPRAGMDVRDLAGLAGGDLRPVAARGPRRATRTRRSRTGRSRLETTFDGAGVLTGDLTPECARGGDRGAGRAVGPGRRGGHRGRRPSGTTTRCRRRCSGWSPPGCCPSGPGSR